MHKVHRVSSLRAAVNSARNDKKTIGFVPTMGNLHDGHVELVRAAKLAADFVVVSIYVNPTQFGESEDIDRYPTTPEEDARLLGEVGADLLFLPEHNTMYPSSLENQTVVYVPIIGSLHCGVSRPEHFAGVTTVVSRLFNMVQPDVAVFGKKDFQQLAIVRRMVTDLAYPVEVVGADTIRGEDGLAMSSRNGYLTAKQLTKASLLYKVLQKSAKQLRQHSLSIAELEEAAKKRLSKGGFEPQYFSVCRQDDLMPAQLGDTKLVILAAAKLGKARLIDNIEVLLEPASKP